MQVSVTDLTTATKHVHPLSHTQILDPYTDHLRLAGFKHMESSSAHTMCGSVIVVDGHVKLCRSRCSAVKQPPVAAAADTQLRDATRTAAIISGQARLLSGFCDNTPVKGDQQGRCSSCRAAGRPGVGAPGAAAAAAAATAAAGGGSRDEEVMDEPGAAQEQQDQQEAEAAVLLQDNEPVSRRTRHQMKDSMEKDVPIPALHRSSALPGALEGSPDVWEADSIIDERLVKVGRLMEVRYKVKWKGWPLEASTWEPHANILDQRLFEDWRAKCEDDSVFKVRLC